MRRSVSGATPTVKVEGVKEVMVRHVPDMIQLANKREGDVVWR